MHCETSGPGTITQTWLYNGELFPDENTKVLVIEDGSRLIIASVDITDSGSYTCQARNNFGISELTAYVHVHCESCYISTGQYQQYNCRHNFILLEYVL